MPYQIYIKYCGEGSGILRCFWDSKFSVLEKVNFRGAEIREIGRKMTVFGQKRRRLWGDI
jgi:hypothetical protein|tara:strand:- start:1086 stop:1265 length:180 start_codon:yes stop_codon:yes gene_type:complete